MGAQNNCEGQAVRHSCKHGRNEENGIQEKNIVEQTSLGQSVFNTKYLQHYPINIIDGAIEKARMVPRFLALKKVEKKETDLKQICTCSYLWPKIASYWYHFSQTLAGHYKPKPIFKGGFPPAFSNSSQKTTHQRQILVRAKVADHAKPMPRRENKAMNKCGTGCTACPYILQAKSVPNRGTKWKLNKQLNCTSFNIKCMTECKKRKL